MLSSLLILFLSIGVVGGSIYGIKLRKDNLNDTRSKILVSLLLFGCITLSGVIVGISKSRSCKKKVEEIYKLVDTGLVDCKNRLSKCENLTMGDILKV